MKKIAIILLSIAGLGLSACNTVEGMGKDIKQGGAAIERAADKSK
ncbi:MAG TPA: entericidin A/B family lipoprotein [Limnobacter sp.]